MRTIPSAHAVLDEVALIPRTFKPRHLLQIIGQEPPVEPAVCGTHRVKKLVDRRALSMVREIARFPRAQRSVIKRRSFRTDQPPEELFVAGEVGGAFSVVDAEVRQFTALVSDIVPRLSMRC